MNEDRKNEIRARLAAATPGPWVQWADHGSVYAGPLSNNDPGRLSGYRGDGPVAECPEESFPGDDYEDGYGDDGEGEAQAERNAALIAAAPQDIADLLAEVDRLAAELAEWEQWARRNNERDADPKVQRFRARTEALQDWCDAVSTPGEVRP